jgi:hypothetical protein
MSDSNEDRPADLKVRRRPRPAPDERVDPVDYRQPDVGERAERADAPQGVKTIPSDIPVSPSAPQSDVVAPVRRGRPRREVTVPFSTRLAPDVLELIDNAVASSDSGATIRAVVEEAVRARYGKLSG